MDARGFTQSSLARRSGVERSLINRILHNKARPRYEQIGWLAAALGIDATDLLSHADLPEEVRNVFELLRRAERARDEALAHVERLDGELRLARGTL
jgi:transcriptional regulator with XRE-family HTH domain